MHGIIRNKSIEIDRLRREDLLRLTRDYLSDVLVHYGMWYMETKKQYGSATALELEIIVFRKYLPLSLKRLQALGVGSEAEDKDPEDPLESMSKVQLIQLVKALAKTWVAGDGIWFQAVEARLGMAAAKLVNDAVWAHFAHIEAFKIRRFLGLNDNSGLEGLARALRLRIYLTINASSVSWGADGSLRFALNECRVQQSRQRKQMPAYPCMSAGMVEYSRFAESIDSRIVVECVSCPPEQTSETEFCVWRFRIQEGAIAGI
jgi:hypothetical protein